MTKFIINEISSPNPFNDVILRLSDPELKKAGYKAGYIIISLSTYNRKGYD